ncbi:MAG: C40 family peptidase [bacterium]|jgi:cell wall-associated NlpC family hydrolase
MLLFLAALLATPNAVIVKPVANMHAAPSEDAAVVSQAIFGVNIGVLEVQPGWVKIRTPDEYTGWVAQASVLRSAEPYAVEGVQVESLFANLYREPDVTKHQPLLTLPYEARLEVASVRDERWMEVRLPGGATAWVQRGDVSAGRPHASIPELIAFSKRFLGLPYLWGGTSTFGYDCSGFTQMLCRRRGIAIPRDAAPQAHWEGMAAVDRSALEPGDLLYFGSSQEKITHTGMYIGNGEFIHASTHERPVVQIGRVDDPYWAGLFVAARRPK